MLHRTLGAIDDAVLSFELAHAEHESLRSPTLLMRSARELSRALRARGHGDDGDRAERREGVTRGFAATLGLSFSESPRAPELRRAELAREGATWRLSFGGRETSVKDAKGFRVLVTLLATPGQAVHVLELAGAGEIRSAVQSSEAPRLDAQAKTAYRRRLQELALQREDAEARGDSLGVESARAELEMIEDELSGALGLGGRDRRGGATERARVAVAKSLGRALDLVRAAHPDAGAHLTRSLRTGTLCVYDPDVAVEWTLRVTM